MNRELIETSSYKVVIPGCCRKGGAGSVSGTLGFGASCKFSVYHETGSSTQCDEKEKDFKILSGRKILQLIHRCSEDTKKAKDGI